MSSSESLVKKCRWIIFILVGLLLLGGAAAAGVCVAAYWQSAAELPCKCGRQVYSPCGRYLCDRENCTDHGAGGAGRADL